jgi:hypothetical protein
MAKQLKCGDLMPGCDFVAKGATEAEVLEKAAAQTGDPSSNHQHQRSGSTNLNKNRRTQHNKPRKTVSKRLTRSAFDLSGMRFRLYLVWLWTVDVEHAGLVGVVSRPLCAGLVLAEMEELEEAA